MLPTISDEDSFLIANPHIEIDDSIVFGLFIIVGISVKIPSLCYLT